MTPFNIIVGILIIVLAAILTVRLRKQSKAKA
jgi:hypothetical protein